MIITCVEHSDGKIKKSSLEALTVARHMADAEGVDVGAIVLGDAATDALAEYGADVIVQISVNYDTMSDTKAMAALISGIAQNKSAKAVVLAHNSFGKGIAGRLAVRLDAGLVSGITKMPSKDGGAWVFEKNVFSGKAYAQYKINSSVAVVSVMPNSFPPVSNPKSGVVESMSMGEASSVSVSGRDQVTGTVSLPEAELVVSAGRGMKGPENWGIIDELAEVLGATTACSRPVADADWRPHHEHVGQTGIAIRPNLYIAIGISGAIQHLAGVNNSKTIVVINKDPEAPFFKAADYGVCADLFDVVPRLTEAIRKYKS